MNSAGMMGGYNSFNNSGGSNSSGGGGNNSFNNLMMKSGFSRDQLSQLARDRGLSSASLSNMMNMGNGSGGSGMGSLGMGMGNDRKSSFDQLMSLDFQSLQSIDNLANLIQTSGGNSNPNPSSGMKNWSADSNSSSSGGGSSAGGGAGGGGSSAGGGAG